MNHEQKLILATTLTLYLHLKQTKKKKRRWWVRPILQKRYSQGDWYNLVQEMRLQDTESFFEYTRLTVALFDDLLRLVGPLIKKQTIRRQPIPEGARLALTLRYLATGDSLPSLSYAYRIGKSTACNIIHETCEALWQALSDKFVKFPNKNEFRMIANEFEDMWSMSHCLGTLDGKHVNIKAPNNTGSQYFNYKKTFSIVLSAICDAKYNFTYVDIGAFGSTSDGGILRECNFGQMLFNETLDIPDEECLPNTNVQFPFYFVGDEAFSLNKHLLRPFGRIHLSREERIFNYRLSRARRCIENAFGILVSRFRIYHRTIFAQPETVDSIIKATICLHNFIKKNEMLMPSHCRRYCSNNYVDRYDEDGNIVPGDWRSISVNNSSLTNVRQLERRIGSRNATQECVTLRKMISEYLNSPEGNVPWQDNIS